MTGAFLCAAALLVSGLARVLNDGTVPAVAPDPPETVHLWEGEAPGAKGAEPGDIPTLTIYRPPAERRTRAAVVICPGGGYGGLAAHEGQPVAEWLNTLGITGLVLKYRLGPRYHHPVMLGDASRAIRLARSRAPEWNLDPGRIGILGFSAGGHLASTVATHFDAGKPDASDAVERVSSRPDAAILIYPVITLSAPYAHMGSRRNLLGDNPAQELVDLLSNEKQVTPQTPPTFLVHTADDAAVPCENSVLFMLALRKARVPVELHVFAHGPHGLGLGKDDPAFRAWPAACAQWLKERRFLEPGAVKP